MAIRARARRQTPPAATAACATRGPCVGRPIPIPPPPPAAASQPPPAMPPLDAASRRPPLKKGVHSLAHTHRTTHSVGGGRLHDTQREKRPRAPKHASLRALPAEASSRGSSHPYMPPPPHTHTHDRSRACAGAHAWHCKCGAAPTRTVTSLTTPLLFTVFKSLSSCFWGYQVIHGFVVPEVGESLHPLSSAQRSLPQVCAPTSPSN